MTEQITNKDYITINRDGVFVDGKPATKYHGKEIAKLEQIKQALATPGTEDILEIRALQSDTYGQVLEFGNPVPSNIGACIWMQAVTKTGTTPWIFRLDNGLRTDTAAICAFQCAWAVNQNPKWIKTLLESSQKSNTFDQGKRLIRNVVKVRIYNSL
ncbi:MAG: hypothetical protein R8M71_03495 [Alphaproteobacteria bacterium]|jgi:hypothetical protein|nr:hypothetical protein [Alphaproteobacteria bacterium]MDW2995997.1 hypothetical protein [Alphaproteobacteria bacterium]